MNTSFEDQIRERAYHMWLAAGMADGQAHEHWVCAEQAVRGEMAGETVTAKAKPARARKATETKAPAKPKAKPAAKAKH